MHIGSLTFTLTPINILALAIFILGVFELVRTWGVTTRPLSFAVVVLGLIQLLWILGAIGFPGAPELRRLDVWLAITSAALVPISVALAWMAAGRFTAPIASVIGLLAFVEFLVATGIVRISGLM